MSAVDAVVEAVDESSSSALLASMMMMLLTLLVSCVFALSFVVVWVDEGEGRNRQA